MSNIFYYNIIFIRGVKFSGGKFLFPLKREKVKNRDEFLMILIKFSFI